MSVKIKTQSDLQQRYFSTLTKLNRAGVFALLSTRRDGSDPFTAYDKSVDNLASIAHDPKYNWKNRNWWCSILSYSHHRRTKNDVIGLNGLWIDADLVEHGIDKGRFLYPPNFDRLLKIAGLSQPTAVIDSAHGFYLIYLFSQQVVNHAPWTKRVWQRLEDKIIKLFNNACYQMYGTRPGDTSASDFARVLRVPGTNNVKKPLKDHEKLAYLPKWPAVRMVWFDPNNRRDMVKFWEDKYLPLVKRNKRRKRNRRVSNRQHPHKSQKGKRIRSSIVSVKIPRNRLWQKTRDLLKLLSLRHGHMTSCHENFLFIYACLVIRINGTAGTIQDLQRLNKKFDTPISSSRIHNLAIEIKHDKIEKYNFRKFSTLNKYLHITPTEQRYMLNIMDRAEANRRKRNRKQQRRDAHHYTITKRHRRDLKVFEMAKNGFTRREISKQFNVSRRTVTRIIAKLQRELPKTTPRVDQLIIKLSRLHIRPVLIAKRLNVSLRYISKVIRSPS